MLMRYPNQFHCWFQIQFILHNKRDVSRFRSPAMPAGFACGEDLLLNIHRQSDVAVAMAMDVHKHATPDKERILVDSCILPFRYTG